MMGCVGWRWPVRWGWGWSGVEGEVRSWSGCLLRDHEEEWRARKVWRGRVGKERSRWG